MNPLFKMGSDDAVNINDKCRKQSLELENITCVCLKCICFLLANRLQLFLLNLVCSPTTEARFSILRPWLRERDI